MTTPLQTLRRAAEWIAENDQPHLTDVESVAELDSVRLVAYVFKLDARNVAMHVVSLRGKRITD